MAKTFPFDAKMNRDTKMVTKKVPIETVLLKKGKAVIVTTEIGDDLAIVKVEISGATRKGIVPFGSYDRVE